MRGSVGGAAARPDQAVAIVRVDQAGVDRSREARVVQLDRQIVAVLAGGLLPGGAEFGGAGEDAEVGRLVVVVLLRGPQLGRFDVQGQGLDGPAERAVVLLVEGTDGGPGSLSCLTSGRAYRGLEWRSTGRGAVDPAGEAPQRQRRTAGPEFLVSRGRPKAGEESQASPLRWADGAKGPAPLGQIRPGEAA